MLERLKSLCKSRNINFSRLEKELNFANGSLAKSKEDKISAMRVLALARYFNVSMEYILCGAIPNNSFSVEENTIIRAYRESDSLTQAMVLRNLGLDIAEKRDIG